MKIENQVTSLELSKRLTELGVKQDSLFMWVKIAGEWQVVTTVLSLTTPRVKESYSAFTVAELGEMFGKRMVLSGYSSRLNQFSCRYIYSQEVIKRFEADTEADARAKMLIYLIEHELVKTPLVKPSV